LTCRTSDVASRYFLLLVTILPVAVIPLAAVLLWGIRDGLEPMVWMQILLQVAIVLWST
jgi:hypothetical protein